MCQLNSISSQDTSSDAQQKPYSPNTDSRFASATACREVHELKEELAMMQLMRQLNSSPPDTQHQPYSEAPRERLREAVMTWLQQSDESTDVAATGLAGLPLSSVRQLREVLFTFKVRKAVDRVVLV